MEGLSGAIVGFIVGFVLFMLTMLAKPKSNNAKALVTIASVCTLGYTILCFVGIILNIVN